MKLDLKELISKLVNTPMVIEEGTSGIWTYRKWNSGVVECWGISTKTAAITTTWGNGYVSPLLSDSFPVDLFISKPSAVSIFPAGSVSIMLVNGAPDDITKDGIKYYLFRPGTTANSLTYSIHINAIGAWK